MPPLPLSPNPPSASDQPQPLRLAPLPSLTHLQPVVVSSAHLLLLLPVEDSRSELLLPITTALRPPANPVDSLSELLLDLEVRPQLRTLLFLEVCSGTLELARVDCLDRAPLLLLHLEDYSGLPLRNLRTVQRARVEGSSERRTRLLLGQVRATSLEEELLRLVCSVARLRLPLLLHRTPSLRQQPTSLELQTGNEVLKTMATPNKRNKGHRCRVHLDQVSEGSLMKAVDTDPIRRQKKLRLLRLLLLRRPEASLSESLPSPLKGKSSPCM